MRRQPSIPHRRPLTDRELAIAGLLAEGLSTEQIAGSLFLSPHTVAAHLAKMLRNFNARNRTELVARLFVHGILASGEWPPRASAAGNGAASEPGALEHAVPAESPVRAKPAEDAREAVVFLLNRAVEPGTARRI